MAVGQHHSPHGNRTRRLRIVMRDPTETRRFGSFGHSIWASVLARLVIQIPQRPSSAILLCSGHLRPVRPDGFGQGAGSDRVDQATPGKSVWSGRRTLSTNTVDHPLSGLRQPIDRPEPALTEKVSGSPDYVGLGCPQRWPEPALGVHLSNP